MARYYFHITHDNPRVADTEGLLLADRAAAWEEAKRTCGAMIREINGSLALGSDWQLEVDDDDGPLFTIRFGAHNNR